MLKVGQKQDVTFGASRQKIQRLVTEARYYHGDTPWHFQNNLEAKLNTLAEREAIKHGNFIGLNKTAKHLFSIGEAEQKKGNQFLGNILIVLAGRTEGLIGSYSNQIRLLDGMGEKNLPKKGIKAFEKWGAEQEKKAESVKFDRSN